MKIIDGDLLKITTGIIAHQVNTLGIMGAGLAKSLGFKKLTLKLRTFVLY